MVLKMYVWKTRNNKGIADITGLIRAKGKQPKRRIHRLALESHRKIGSKAPGCMPTHNLALVVYTCSNAKALLNNKGKQAQLSTAIWYI